MVMQVTYYMGKQQSEKQKAINNVESLWAYNTERPHKPLVSFPPGLCQGVTTTVVHCNSSQRFSTGSALCQMQMTLPSAS